MYRRQQLLPYEVQHALHVPSATGDSDNSILVRHDNAKLPKRPVTAIAPVPAAPELVAVPLIPIAGGIAAVGSLDRGGSIDPFRRNKLFAVPLAVLQIKLAELRDILSTNVQPRTTERVLLFHF